MMNKSSIKKTFIAFIATITLIIASATVALGFFVADSDVIFPNVSAEGVDLSGMTIAEANNRLINLGFETNADSVAVTVNFPNGISFTILGNDAGLSLNAEETVQAAFSHGRNGSFFGNTFAFVGSLLGETDLNGTSEPVLNEHFVREKVAVHTQAFNETLHENASYIIDDYKITIVTAGFEPVNENELFNLVEETLFIALQEGTHLTVDFMPALSESIDIDLSRLYDMLHIDAVDAVYDPETFSATQSTTGVSFDLDAATAQLTAANIGEEFIIPLVFTEPEVTTEYLQDRLFRDELASRTTHVAGTNARLNNVTLAASYIDGLVLNPGDVFSFNEVVGRRTAERGFQNAGGFRDGQLVDMIGGGICQVSSTLYDNVLHAYLEVIARRAHSRPIAYLPLGHDAAIYWGQLDLQFRNNTPYPIRIEIEFDGRSMTSRFIGTRTSDYTIRIASYSTATPFETTRRADASVPYGETRVEFAGANGFVTRTYRVIYDTEGNEISRTFIARDVYRAQNRILLVPLANASE
ncbi:MAG: VanW family protein [Defluviitaleaceae bacterium]|nr:VanW family protein [Defluviitaleaceae bacterium]